MMKYYSDRTLKVYDTEEELHKAEKALDEKEDEEKVKRDARAKRAKEVEEAYKEAEKAYKVYKDKLDAFIKDYGNFHMTLNNADSLFDFFFNHWPF